MYARISRLSSVLKYIGQLDFPVWIDQDVYVETINWPIHITSLVRIILANAINDFALRIYCTRKETEI